MCKGARGGGDVLVGVDIMTSTKLVFGVEDPVLMLS